MSKKKVALACSERLEVKKFCKYCGKHTIHRETK